MSYKTIVISPFAKTMRNGQMHPKNYPYWEEVIIQLQGDDYNIVQIGGGEDKPINVKYPFGWLHDHCGYYTFKHNLKLSQIKDLITESITWISVDTFLPHLNHFYDRKPGVVIFGQSDPKIFGYKENINLLKDRKYLRDKQFWMWEQCTYNEEAFVSPEEVVAAVKSIVDKVE